jgi:hypothetical protein
VRWIRNARGQPVIDRAYNMVQLLNMYMGRSPISDEDVSWEVSNPNQLSVRLRGDQRVFFSFPNQRSPVWQAVSFAGMALACRWGCLASCIVANRFRSVSRVSRLMHAGGTRADTRVTRRSEDQVADGEQHEPGCMHAAADWAEPTFMAQLM